MDETMKVRITGNVQGPDGAIRGTVDLPREEAERLLAIGPHVAVVPEESDSVGSTPTGREEFDVNDSDDSGKAGEATDYEAMTKEELELEAIGRNLAVTRGDGKDGDPLKADYIAALQGHDGQ